MDTISATRLAEIRELQPELARVMQTVLEELWAAKLRYAAAKRMAVNNSDARAHLERAAAAYIATLDRLLEDRADRLQALGLPLAACMQLIRGILGIWVDQDDTTVPEIPDSVLEGFPEPMRLLFKPAAVPSG